MRPKKQTPVIVIFFIVLIGIAVYLVGFYMFWKDIPDRNCLVQNKCTQLCKSPYIGKITLDLTMS